MRSVGRRLGRGAGRILRHARRTHPLTLLALAAVGAVVVALAVRAGPGPVRQLPYGALPPRVGVSDGDRVADYVQATRDELEDLRADGDAGSVYALVSLTVYTTPTALPRILPADDRLRTVAVFVRSPVTNRQTEIVRLPAQRLPDDVLAAMAETATRKLSEAADYAARASAEPDPETRARLESGANVSRAEAMGYAGDCPCVFALVVRGDAEILTLLAAHTLVRSVDPAPEVTDVSRAVFVAPLPEHADVVGPLPDDLTSSVGATVTVRSS